METLFDCCLQGEIYSHASLEGKTSSNGCILHKIPPKFEQCNIGEIVMEGCFKMVFDVMYDNCCDIVDMNLLIAYMASRQKKLSIDV